MATAAKRIILSGIQPTGGVPHLGNYLGALSNWVTMQPTADGPNHRVFYSIVDLHALTMPQDPATLRANTHEMAISLLAVGIDPDRAVLFRQSRVHAHSELAWLLFCRTPVAWLGRMHQWKTKLEAIQQQANLTLPGTTQAEATLSYLKGSIPDLTPNQTSTFAEQNMSVSGPCLGLLAYPVLQAADILLYRATEVPIGEDQVQHMNLTVDIAKSFNSQYKKQVFPVPRGVYASETTKKIMSLRDPTKKMAKSDPSDASRINLTDTPAQILSKIRRATVDSELGIRYDPVARPGVANLLRLYSAFQEPGSVEATLEGAAARFAEYDNARLKAEVGECVVEGLREVRERYARLKGEKGYVDEVLRTGEEKATLAAERTMKDVRKAVGLQ
ncbi:hypothetical protein BC830DRAFT_1118214 [Chytriomyces sp. MP71]|nr:hypothetical protein BC830DRAFT_1118214 [Chytriomyces sp. MP71]